MFYPHDILGSDLPLWQKAGVTAVGNGSRNIVRYLRVSMALRPAPSLPIDGNPLEQDDGSMETYDPHQEKVKTAVSNCLLIALTALVS